MAAPKNKTSGRLSSIGHGTSGGHAAPARAPAKGIMAQAKNPGDPIPDLRNKLHQHSGKPMGNFDHINFPAYEFREFPKMVAGVICNDEDEESTVLAGQSVVREVDEKARLVKLAGVSGVQVDKRWSIDRLTKTLEDAGVDATFDPDA